MRRLSARVWKSSRKFSNHLRSYVYGARLVLDNILEETGFLYVIGSPRCSYPSHRMRGRPLSLVKPRRRFKWNEMANCGDTYVFFDPLGRSESVLSSNSQSFAPHNGCQEVVSKGGLDRFVRPTRSSITLTFNTLGANNKSRQLSRGSKCKPAQMFKNEGPLNPTPTLDKLCNSQGAGGKGTIFNT